MEKDNYPLYDVPYLVRGPNDKYMSAERHEIEKRNQTIVDDYFLARARGMTAKEARKQVAEKHQLTTRRVFVILIWFYEEAEKRKKYDFLEKFSPEVEHIS